VNTVTLDTNFRSHPSESNFKNRRAYLAACKKWTLDFADFERAYNALIQAAPRHLVDSDGGSLRIDNPDISAFTSNGFGDGTHEVRIFDTKISPPHDTWRLVGSVTVKTRATVSASDSSDEPIAELKRGRHFIYDDRGNGNMLVVYIDDYVS
jgi:hypothetical protein